ncbi:sensor histidine kinase [Ferruginibacter sp. SUN002]|uniref:sensor histidine kinase n=1 Tax=Ferruginibacter sp. SUN002 TaxID=2937789 RepID=UPI003D35AF9D
MKGRLHIGVMKGIEKFAQLGVDDSMDFVVQKRIRTINLSIFICLPLISVYWALSYFSKHVLLADFYLFLIVTLIFMLWCNYLKKGESYRIGTLVVLVLSMSVAGILFNNGQEYYVLLISLLSILFYDLRKKQLYLSIFYAVSFVSVEIISAFTNPVEQAPGYIKVVNMIVVLSILLYFLYDIKKVYIEFLKENIEEKRLLQESNKLLVQQAVSLEIKNKNIQDLKNKNEELTSVIYHQLRSPIAAFADILTQYLESSIYTKEEFREMSELVHKKVTGTLSVVDNMLKWSREGVDGSKSKDMLCDVSDVIQKVLIQFQSQVEKKNLKILFSKPLKRYSNADEEHVLIILQNVLSNAVKFSPPNEEIKIEVTYLPDACQVLVSNKGTGISADRIKALFSHRHIVSEKGTMDETGTGFGLKICQKLVEKNHGSIQILSKENRNTTVVIELPVMMPKAG